MPDVYMIAGPNGAGKTTAAKAMLRDFLQTNEFVNADEIAKGISPFNADEAAVDAGKVMLSRISSLISKRKNFAFESTAAGKGHAQSIQRAQKVGYRATLIFLWLPSADLAVDRVAIRVAQGGHNIPEQDIRRRFGRGLVNLVDLYLPLVDRALIIDARYPLEILQDKQGIGIKVLARKDESKVYFNDKMWPSVLSLVEAARKE